MTQGGLVIFRMMGVRGIMQIWDLHEQFDIQNSTKSVCNSLYIRGNTVYLFRNVYVY